MHELLYRSEDRTQTEQWWKTHPRESLSPECSFTPRTTFLVENFSENLKSKHLTELQVICVRV